MTHQHGFTLIEALIYIALFTLVIGGGVISVYQIFDGQAQVQTLARRESDINFILRKLDWLASGEIVSATGDELIVSKGISQYTLNLNDTIIELEGEPLSTMLEVSVLEFSLSGNTPKILTTTFTIDEEVIGPITRYVRSQ